MYLSLYITSRHSIFWVRLCKQELQEGIQWWACHGHHNLPKSHLLSGCKAPSPSNSWTWVGKVGVDLVSWLAMQCHKQKEKWKSRDHMSLRTSFASSYKLEIGYLWTVIYPCYKGSIVLSLLYYEMVEWAWTSKACYL
jgi:hypothetical protein